MSNVSVLGPAIGDRVDESGFSWNGENRLTAADLLAAESVGDERAANEEARGFLRDAAVGWAVSRRTPAPTRPGCGGKPIVCHTPPRWEVFQGRGQSALTAGGPVRQPLRGRLNRPGWERELM
jgi:hypothetical protein